MTPRILVVHQNDGTDVRVGKLCRTFSVHYDTIYLGWDRDGVDHPVDLGSTKRHLFRRRAKYGQGGLRSRAAFLLWVMRLILALRPSTVVAVNEEVGFALAPLRAFAGFKLVIDIHDPLADRLKSGRLDWLLRWVQSVARWASDALFVTDERRYARLEGRYKCKAEIVPNYPDPPDFPLPDEPPGENAEVRIAVIGSLNVNRGMLVLSDAVDLAGGCVLELAGWFTDSESAKLAERSHARYHGILGMQASLRLIASCDVVFCFYNPEIPNNINASPNKIFEAICVGKKSIVNAETVVSSWVHSNEFGYVCDYHDVAALAGIIDTVRDHLAAHRLPDPRLLAYAQGRLFWEAAEPALLAAVR